MGTPDRFFFHEQMKGLADSIDFLRRATLIAEPTLRDSVLLRKIADEVMTQMDRALTILDQRLAEEDDDD